MVQVKEPSNTDLVYEVLMAAERPLTFQEIFDKVNQRRPITTRNPKGTIRNALGQGRQLVSLGDGRYGYLPHLIAGSVLRLPLAEKKPANAPLIYTDEVMLALWPSFFESQKRRRRELVHARLPSGDEATLSLDFFGQGVWGSLIPDELRRYLIDKRASAGDWLLVRVVDADAARCDLWFESRLKRDPGVVAQRDKQLADAAYQILHKSPNIDMTTWDLVVALLARGHYRAEVAPDPLVEVLKADPRFVDAGLSAWMLAERMTPEMGDLIQRRRGLDKKMGLTEPQAAPEIDVETIARLRAVMEREMADIRKAIEEQEFSSIDEVNAFLEQELAAGGPVHREPETPLEQARELVYDAWEAPSQRERIRLARKALEISLDCADAYVLLAQETARNPKEAAELYARGVAAGERALGREAFEEAVGDFWGIIETRPYMRARAGLAQALWAMGRRQEAIDHVWDMLRLNPGDNQGMRYILLSWLLEIGEDAQAEELLETEEYRDDVSAIWTYGRALHAYRAEGDSKNARDLLAGAINWNPHVPAYLLGRKRLPRQLPPTIGLGDESEAIACAAQQMAAWRQTSGALEWLERQV
ncbi:MAG: hypothetical protein HYY30_11135 [Chloroflexi bacterium]|nr:hypothetical protein [Chloroflexota bacterium]